MNMCLREMNKCDISVEKEKLKTKARVEPPRHGVSGEEQWVHTQTLRFLPISHLSSSPSRPLSMAVFSIVSRVCAFRLGLTGICAWVCLL